MRADAVSDHTRSENAVFENAVSAPAGSRPADPDTVLAVSDLVVEYRTSRGDVRAVDGVDMRIGRGQFVGVVGESGCGKSTLIFALASLLSPPAAITGGRVEFKGQNLVTMSDKSLRALRWRDFSIVMQSAMNALNPVTSIGAQFDDVLRAHAKMTRAQMRDRSVEVLRLVGIDPIHLRSYPHQLSGGMRQRAMIAMALLFTPDLVIMDEPTSALDVVAQRSLMAQIKELQRQLGFAVVFVTHDMSLVSHFADQMVVMYAGQVIEQGPTRTVFDSPAHPYSRGLLDAFPSVRGPRVELTGIPGSPPELASLPAGCRFAPRCPAVMPACRTIDPPLYQVGATQARCLLHDPDIASDQAAS